MSNKLLLAGFSFGRHCLGLITRPYETFRRIVEKGDTLELAYVAACVCVYLAIASLVKQSLFHPFLLTQQFLVLGVGAAATYVVAVGLFWFVGRCVGAKGNWRGFAVAWGYTLMPTLLWFLGTSLLYVFIPPPRTTSILGFTFSIIFLLFSATLLFWKVTLSYLSLRFGLRLDLGKLVLICSIVLPMLAIYSFGMYKVGIFRVPFI